VNETGQSEMNSIWGRIGPALAPRSRHLERRPLDWLAIGLTLLLCVVWGVQQTAMKMVASDVDPIMQLGIRFAAAAVFFGIVTWRQEGRAAFRDGTLPSGLLLGSLFSLEFMLVALALRRTSAAHTIVFLYTAPIFTALGLRVLPHERLSGPQWGGIALAIGGIATAFFQSSDRSWADLMGGDALAILAGAAWGMSNVALRMGKVSGAAIAKTIFYQVGMGGVILIGFAYLNHTTHVHWTPTSIAVQAYQIILVALLSYLIWFWLLGHYLTSRLMLLSLLTPLFGVAAGAWLLHEVITLSFIAGAVAVLGGIFIVNRFG
jgi:drug/metabolite transporter (DMT)-like permease